MNAATLVLIAAIAHLAPLHIASLLGHSQAAWEYVGFGIEACVLWGMVAVLSRMLAIRAVAAWGSVEGGMRAACRLQFDMSQPPPRVAGQNLCDIATGTHASLLSLFLAAIAVLCLDVSRRK